MPLSLDPDPDMVPVWPERSAAGWVSVGTCLREHGGSAKLLAAIAE
jgi:hypothetical protein